MNSRNVISIFAGLILGAVIYLGVGLSVETKSTPLPLLERTTKEPSKPNITNQSSDQAKMLDLSEESVVLLQGPIRENGFTVAAAIKKASREGKPIWLLIDSPGGSVIVGAQIISAMQSAGVEVNTVCLTLCASMGAIIHQYGTKRYMVDRSFLMFHEASGGVAGTVPQMLSQLNSMNTYINKMVATIATRAGLSFEEFSSKLAAELWIDAQDATTSKFNDEIVNVYFEPEKTVNTQKSGDNRAKMEAHNILNVQ